MKGEKGSEGEIESGIEAEGESEHCKEVFLCLLSLVFCVLSP